jgi:hypothetical protein
MIVRSNIITRATIGTAVAAVPGVAFQDTFSREGWYVPIREFKPRQYARGFEFFLSGSSAHRAQHDREEFAATWVEWGVVIDALYQVDPSAQIGWYESRADFLAKTSSDYRIRLGEIARADVPWLAAA